MNEVFIFIAIISFLTSLIFWYIIKERLKENDFDVDFFFHHMMDIPNFIRLISKEKNTHKRKSYLKSIIGLAISLSSLIVSILFTLLNDI